MPHLEEGEIHAWLDGAVDEVEALRIEGHVAACERCAAEVATARGLIAGASRILLSLDDVPGGVVPSVATKPPLRRHSPWFSRPLIQIAASLMLAAGIGVVATREQRSAADRVTIEFKTAATGADSAEPAGPAPETPPMSTADFGGVASSAVQRSPAGPRMAPSPTAPRKAPPPAPEKASPPPPVVGEAVRSEARSLADARDENALRRVERDSTPTFRARASETPAPAQARTREALVVATGAAARLELNNTVAVPMVNGGACFALDVAAPPGDAGIPLVPRRMRIQLAGSPAIDAQLGQAQSATSAANVQGAGAVSRQAVAPAQRTYAAPTSEPAEPLAWREAARDSIVAYWGTATDVVVFRLQVIGDVVTGSVAPQMTPERRSTVSGRRSVCGGG